MNLNVEGTAARADLVARRKWKVWEIVLAYLVLLAIASISIWLVDRAAMRVQ